MKIPKIDLKKVEQFEDKVDKVTEIAVKWARKSLKDPKLTWDTAMDNAAEEIGLNTDEFYTLVYAREPFKNLAYGLGIYEHRRMAKFEFEKIRKEYGWDKRGTKKIKV